MEVLFKNESLRELCYDDKALKKKFGKENLKKIRVRLEDFSLVENLDEIPTSPPPRRHELVGDRKGQFAVDLFKGMRLVFIPANEPIPLKPDGGFDLKNITSVKIIELEDYH